LSLQYSTDGAKTFQVKLCLSERKRSLGVPRYNLA